MIYDKVPSNHMLLLLLSSHEPIGPQPYPGHKEVPRSTGHIMVTTRYSDQQGSKSRQKVMRLYKRWHRPIAKRFIKLPLLHIESSLDKTIGAYSLEPNEDYDITCRSSRSRVGCCILCSWSVEQGKWIFPCPRTCLKIWFVIEVWYIFVLPQSAFLIFL